jgi:hypothetical protein
MRHQPAGAQSFPFFAQTAAAVALILCLGAGARAQQSRDQNPPPQQQDQQQAQPQDQSTVDSSSAPRPRPTYASQDADKPPYSRDRSMQSQAAPYGPTQGRSMQNQRGQYASQQQNQQVPSTLTIPAGTILTVRVNNYLSSDKNKIGDQFTAELERPVVVNGWVVAQRGQTVAGQVKTAKKAGRVSGTSELDLELTDIAIADGRQLPVLTQLWKASGGTTHGADAATIAGSTGLGAAIGAAADWGTGAAIGAGAGAVAGIATVLLTRGRPTIVGPESELTFRLQDPVTVDTTESQQAFYPASQQDYAANGPGYRGPGPVPGYPYPYPAPYPYYSYGPYYGCGYWGCYGYPYVGLGFYGGWYGWGGAHFHGGGFHGGGFHGGFHR